MSCGSSELMTHIHWCDDCQTAWQHELGECADVKVMTCPQCEPERSRESAPEPAEEQWTNLAVQVRLRVNTAMGNEWYEARIHSLLQKHLPIWTSESLSVKVISRWR